MYRVRLSDSDAAEVRRLTGELAARYTSVEDPVFLREATTYAQELPRGLRAGLNTFRFGEPKGACVVAGYPIDNDRIGRTPGHWRECKGARYTLEEEFFFFLCGCLLGDPIGWASQQDGYLMHDILPIREHEHEQLGSGSATLLTWHTEDAFHPLRTDYIGLMCMRNPDDVRTHLASVDDIELDRETMSTLSEARYLIRPDRSHLPQHRGAAGRSIPGGEDLLARTYEWITALDERPEKIAVLFGRPDSPYLRLDPYFMEILDTDPEAGRAFQAIVDEIDRVMTGYCLRAGEAIFIDNYKMVHGREPFRARYDGTDRWLKRLNIVRDIRKSRASRPAAESRIIF